MNRSELIEKIIRIDEDAFFSGKIAPGTRAPLIIVGASALLLCNLSSKNTTKDVDVLTAEKILSEYVYKDLDFNSQCSAYVQCIPYNFEDRLVKIQIETFVIDVYVPSIEDLAVMKLYRWEQIDIDDLTAPEFLEELDWSLLEKLVFSPDEAEGSRISEPDNDRELRMLRSNFRTYEEGWRK